MAVNEIGPADLSPRRFTPRRAMAVLFGLFVLAGFVAYFLTPPVEVRISEAQAKAALDDQIGLTQRAAFGLGEVTPLRLDPAFRNDNRLSLDTALDVTTLGGTTRVEGEVLAGIRYKAPKLYLNRIESDGMRVAPDAPETRSPVSDIMAVARDRVQRERDAMTPDGREALDRLVGREAERLPGLVAQAVTTLIATIPIYDLRDAGLGGSVAALALHDVRFEDGEAVLTLSARAAILRILAFIGMLSLLGLYLFQNVLGHLIFERLIQSRTDDATKQDPPTP